MNKSQEKTGKAEIKALKKPGANSHKGDNGICLVMAGNKKYHGALLLSASMAGKIADLVFIYSTRENQEIIKKIKPKLFEFITVSEKELKQTIRKTDSILIGPGWGKNKGKQKLLNNFLKKYPGKKIIIDADSLGLLNKENLHPNCLLTPHKKEFENLFRLKANKTNIKKMAQKYNCVILLKGKKDVISNGKKTKINKTGNSGMTKGGTGDVLAGLITGLASRNDLFLSACAGAFLNGSAGDKLFKKYSYYFSASDLIEEIPKIINQQEKK